MARSSTTTRKSTGTEDRKADAKQPEDVAASGKAAGSGGKPVESGGGSDDSATRQATPFPMPRWDTAIPFDGKLFERATAFGESVASFGQKRMGRDLETINRFARCTSPQDVAVVQQQWFETAAEDYRGDGVEVLRAAGALVAEAMQTPFQAFGAMTGGSGRDDGDSR